MCFVYFVVGGVQIDWFVIVVVGLQFFVDLVWVVCDYCIGCVEDVGVGLVVLFQVYGLCVGEVFQEVLYVFDFGIVLVVDGLVVVVDYEYVVVVVGQYVYEGVLDGIGVLEFVDEDFVEV